MSYTYCNTECDDDDDDDHLAAVLDTIVEEKEKEDNNDTKFDDNDGNEKVGEAVNGISAAANADFMPRIHNDGTTKYPMPMDIESSDGIIRDRQRRSQRQGQVSPSQQNMNDFLTCCLAQFWCGILGSGIVWCSNSHRQNYPTRPAFWGFWTAIFVMLFIYFLASIYSYYSYRGY